MAPETIHVEMTKLPRPMLTMFFRFSLHVSLNVTCYYLPYLSFSLLLRILHHAFYEVRL